MRHALTAEWIKLRSIRSPYACLASVTVLTLALAAAVGANAESQGAQPVWNNVLAGLLGYGLVVFMAMAALSMTSEYGTGTIRVTFAVLPRRATVITAKALVLAGVCALTAAVLTPIGLAVGGAFAGVPVPWGATARLLWGVPLVAGMSAVIAVGLGAVLRRTGPVLALVIIWPLLVEGLTTLVPKIGQRLATMLPFTNAHLFLGDPQGLPFAWGPVVGLIVFAATGAVVVLFALRVVQARDA
jgi:ABC-2 type transport system permease protein